MSFMRNLSDKQRRSHTVRAYTIYQIRANKDKDVVAGRVRHTYNKDVRMCMQLVVIQLETLQCSTIISSVYYHYGLLYSIVCSKVVSNKNTRQCGGKIR